MRATLASQFDDLLTQIGQLAGDSGFNGINLLGGDTLTVTLNETGTSTTDRDRRRLHQRQGRSVEHRNVAANNWATRRIIHGRDRQLDRGAHSLRSESQTLSASLSTVQIRQDFTKATINTLQTGSADLTLANSNEEGANLLALQTRQQLSTTALSLASQADQNVLRLFQ